MTAITDLVATVAAGAGNATGLQAVVQTNVLPDIVLYDARSSGPSLLDLIGVKSRIVVRKADGSVIAAYGDDTSFNPLITAALLTVVAASAIIVAGVLRPLIRRGR